jgi:hypothetical protein
MRAVTIFGCSVFWGSLTAQALHASSAPRLQNALGRNRCDFPCGLAWRSGLISGLNLISKCELYFRVRVSSMCVLVCLAGHVAHLEFLRHVCLFQNLQRSTEFD